MSVLNRIASFQGRRDEVPNQELARDLAQSRNEQGIHEIAKNLWNENRDIQSDCLKVLYEIGYLAPELIADHVNEFLKLLINNKNRSIVWGTMAALSSIAAIKADEIFPHVEQIKHVLKGGSVITRNNGVKILADVAAARDDYREAIFPYLLEHLKTCRPKEVTQHAERIIIAVNASTSRRFIQVLEKRMREMRSEWTFRLKKVIKEAESRAATM
ncbi:MAG: hypothetical protein SCK70_05735 [bacterium]|nr:hypothetical protein [bacterium]